MKRDGMKVTVTVTITPEIPDAMKALIDVMTERLYRDIRTVIALYTGR